MTSKWVVCLSSNDLISVFATSLVPHPFSSIFPQIWRKGMKDQGPQFNKKQAISSRTHVQQKQHRSYTLPERDPRALPILWDSGRRGVGFRWGWLPATETGTSPGRVRLSGWWSTRTASLRRSICLWGKRSHDWRESHSLINYGLNYSSRNTWRRRHYP